jgi:hypothetical protein
MSVVLFTTTYRLPGAITVAQARRTKLPPPAPTPLIFLLLLAPRPRSSPASRRRARWPRQLSKISSASVVCIKRGTNHTVQSTEPKPTGRRGPPTSRKDCSRLGGGRVPRRRTSQLMRGGNSTWGWLGWSSWFGRW